MASTENKELVIDPRIIGVFKQVTIRAMGEITRRLIEKGLLDEELEQTELPLTQEGLKALFRGGALAFGFAFSRAKVALSLKDWEVDHLGLTDRIVRELGQPEVSFIPDIQIRFTGENPIVEKFTVRWDKEGYFETPQGREKSVICNVTFGDRMRFSPGNVTDHGNQTSGFFPRLGQRRHSND